MNILFGVTTLLGGALLVGFRERLNNFDKQLQELPHTYARRDDVRDRFEEIRNLLQRIEDKVDQQHGKT